MEVENALAEHPAVAESAVVSSPDPTRGEVRTRASWSLAVRGLRKAHTGHFQLNTALDLKGRKDGHALTGGYHQVALWRHLSSGKAMVKPRIW